DKRMMKPAEIVAVLSRALEKLHAVNPAVRVILTVSPVRYFAFGHHENTVSKAQLFSAIHELQEQHPAYYYFPAYELVMDDLRDYRFFAEDMLHPNYQATDYVWDKLCQTLIDVKTLGVMKEMDELLLAARHKPRNPKSEAHQKFVQKNLERLDRLEQQCKFNLQEERAILRRFSN
ncbi:MAG TPA: GSCFA domain-containing protein, partial [Chitinophagales bacterium]|nr:GSCFA domain-containing protein [Chitinophagales bacterium]